MFDDYHITASMLTQEWRLYSSFFVADLVGGLPSSDGPCFVGMFANGGRRMKLVKTIDQFQEMRAILFQYVLTIPFYE
jgi:hypothetical protein